MSLLSDYRLRIKSLLDQPDIEQTLVLEGMRPDIAVRISGSRSVIAQGSLARKPERRKG